MLHSQKWHPGNTLFLYLCLHTRAVDAKSALLLDFSRTTFWMQIHNFPAHLATQEIGESIGKTLGQVVQVADPEDDDSGGEFFRVQIVLDITRPLPRCCKLWAERKLVGWVVKAMAVLEVQHIQVMRKKKKLQRLLLSKRCRV